jgi:NAD(P)-dependent dehydrogenase (short-subunit alcohol dehydrogenase family)
MSGLVWCTGAGKGIGRAICLEYARRGWTVVASARTEADLDLLVADATALGGRIVPLPLDVTDEAAVEAAVARIQADHGPIDLAILNAGTHTPVGLADFTVATFRRLMEVNFFGVVNGLAAMLPPMRARGTGHIAIVSSVAGYCGLPTAAAYGATKAALINMAEALQPEMAAAGLRLSLVNPGFVKTPLTDRNPFPMPFLMSAEEAARRIADGLGRGGFEITFPRRFTYGLKLLRTLPYPLFFAITRRLLQPR